MIAKKLKTFLGRYQTVAIIGGQWGDEGKGKFVDLFAGWANIVARGTGGANAGHTIEADGQKHVLHLVPSGILHDKNGVTTVCGNGMAIDPRSLIEELDQLPHENFLLAHNATLVLPQHLLLDQLREKRAGKAKIGTTGRGIGPAYTDRVARIGLTANSLLDQQELRDKLKRNLEEKHQLLASWNQKELASVLGQSDQLGTFYSLGKGFDLAAITAAYYQYGQRLKPFIADTDRMMQRRVEKSRILLEGAQAIHLGINTGTYPFVTSSDCSVHGLALGVGLRERDVDLTILVVKVPMTRVGAGPFPTELGGIESEEYCNDSAASQRDEAGRYPAADINSEISYEQGVAIRRIGNEYGATTGRPRRTGWLDLVLLRDAIQKSRPCVLALTKLDVLDTCRVISVCIGYRYSGPNTRIGQVELVAGDCIQDAILEPEVLRHCQPLYKEFEGWQYPTSQIREVTEIPAQLKRLIDFIAQHTQTPVALISVGPDRDQTIFM